MVAGLLPVGSLPQLMRRTPTGLISPRRGSCRNDNAASCAAASMCRRMAFKPGPIRGDWTGAVKGQAPPSVHGIRRFRAVAILAAGTTILPDKGKPGKSAFRINPTITFRSARPVKGNPFEFKGGSMNIIPTRCATTDARQQSQGPPRS